MAEGEPQGAAGKLGVGSGGEQDVAGLGHARGAGGAGGAFDALGVEEQQQRVALAPGEAEVRVGGKPLDGVSAEDGVGHFPEHGGDQLVAQGADPGGEVLAPLGGEDGGDREGRDGGHVQGAGADVPLLAASVQDGYGALVAAEQQRADAVGAADLVAADRHGGEAAAA